MCLTETYSKICVSKNIRYISYSEWSGTRRYFVAIALDYTISKDMKLNGTHQPMDCADR